MILVFLLKRFIWGWFPIWVFRASWKASFLSKGDTNKVAFSLATATHCASPRHTLCKADFWEYLLKLLCYAYSAYCLWILSPSHTLCKADFLGVFSKNYCIFWVLSVHIVYLLTIEIDINEYHTRVFQYKNHGTGNAFQALIWPRSRDDKSFKAWYAWHDKSKIYSKL